MKVKQVIEWLDSIAPMESAEAFDNVGLLMGDADAEVSKILFALDVTEAVADEAIEQSCELIIAHHPFIFHALKRINYTGPQGRTLLKLAQNGINVIGAHTNWDKAAGGVGDSLAYALDLQSIESADDYVRVGTLPVSLSPDDFSDFVCERLLFAPRIYAVSDQPISRVAVAGGAYGQGYRAALSMGAQAFVVGEIAHHEIIDACAQGLSIYDSGHYATEYPGVVSLYHRFLAEAANAGWNAGAILHDKAPYPGAYLA